MLGIPGGFLRKLTNFGPAKVEAVESVSMEAASPGGSVSKQLPVQPLPKAQRKAAAFSSYLTTTRQSDAPLASTDRRLATTDITSYRNGANTTQIVRDIAASSPDLAAAVFAYLRTAITGSFTAVANNMDGTFNVEATNLLQQIIARMDKLPNYSDGFGGAYSIRSVSESLGKELLLSGACSMEMVLDKARVPWRFQPIHVGQIKFIPDGNDVIPQQWLASEKIDLDIPTFFYTSLDQDLLTAYATSPLEPALKPTLFAEDFVQDLWRVVKRAVHPRQHVKIIWEKLESQIPAEMVHDADARSEWMNSVISEVTNKINNLGIDEALVYYDFIEIERETNGNVSLSAEWQTLQDIANSKMSTGAKTMPAILGHGVGSSNIASTESMLFVKAASGAIQEKLNEIFSRAFTLAVRLFGFDVVVTFKYEEVNLRPELELESFRAQKQSRLLELLSLGMLSDEEVSLQLTGKLPPPGYKPLAGTMFMTQKADPSGGATNPTNDGSTLNQNLNSDAPVGGARGSNTKRNPVKAAGNVVDLHA